MRHRAALLFVVVALCSASAEAGWSFRQTTRTSGGQVPTPDSEAKILVEGDDARIEMLAGPGTEMFSPGAYMLVRSTAPAGLFLVDPVHRTYSRLDAVALGQVTAPLVSPEGGASPGVTVSDAKVEKVLEEPGEEIAGFPTTHHRYQKSYTVTIALGPVKMATAHDVVEDVWATTAVDLGADRIGKVLEVTEGFGGMTGMDELARLQEETPAGFVLKRVIVDRSRTENKGIMARAMPSGQGETVTMTVEAHDLVESRIDDSSFALPPGYTETSMFALADEEADERND